MAGPAVAAVVEINWAKLSVYDSQRLLHIEHSTYEPMNLGTYEPMNLNESWSNALNDGLSA